MGDTERGKEALLHSGARGGGSFELYCNPITIIQDADAQPTVHYISLWNGVLQPTNQRTQ